MEVDEYFRREFRSSIEDLNLMEVLWRQDADMGVGRGAYDISFYREPLQNENTPKVQNTLKAVVPVMEDGAEEILKLKNPIIDAETGEIIHCQQNSCTSPVSLLNNETLLHNKNTMSGNNCEATKLGMIRSDTGPDINCMLSYDDIDHVTHGISQMAQSISTENSIEDLWEDAEVFIKEDSQSTFNSYPEHNPTFWGCEPPICCIDNGIIKEEKYLDYHNTNLDNPEVLQDHYQSLLVPCGYSDYSHNNSAQLYCNSLINTGNSCAASETYTTPSPHSYCPDNLNGTDNNIGVFQKTSLQEEKSQSTHDLDWHYNDSMLQYDNITSESFTNTQSEEGQNNKTPGTDTSCTNYWNSETVTHTRYNKDLTNGVICGKQRDEATIRRLNLPLSLQDIADTSVEAFTHLISTQNLTDVQLQAIKDIRKRGKNKVAAENCRRRKYAMIDSLEKSVIRMREEKAELEKHKMKLCTERENMNNEVNKMYNQIFKTLRDENGKPYDHSKYRIQYTQDCNVLLISQDINELSNQNG